MANAKAFTAAFKHSVNGPVSSATKSGKAIAQEPQNREQLWEASIAPHPTSSKGTKFRKIKDTCWAKSSGFVGDVDDESSLTSVLMDMSDGISGSVWGESVSKGQEDGLAASAFDNFDLGAPREALALPMVLFGANGTNNASG